MAPLYLRLIFEVENKEYIFDRSSHEIVLVIYPGGHCEFFITRRWNALFDDINCESPAFLVPALEEGQTWKQVLEGLTLKTCQARTARFFG